MKIRPMAPRVKARFIAPMLLLRTDKLPEDASRWAYQLKLDGYRSIAFKTGRCLYVRSRNDKDFSARYPGVIEGLQSLPNDTVIDGEIVALDEEGRPSFNILQNYDSSVTPVHYYVFDVLVLSGKDVMRKPLDTRRHLLETKILPTLHEPVRYIPPLDETLHDLTASVRATGLEGLVAKRRDSRYEPGNARARGRRCASTGVRNSSSAASRLVRRPSMH